jgi:hypothetical protein
VAVSVTSLGLALGDGPRLPPPDAAARGPDVVPGR